LKKIIQVSFPLPKPDPQDLYNILISDINVSMQGFDKKLWIEKRWGNLYHAGFKLLFPSIRDIKRYISGLRLDLTIIGKEEVNPFDFLGVEALRIFASDVYMAIADGKQTFTTIGSTYLDGSRDREERKRIFEQTVNEKSPPELAGAVKDIALFLFPQVAGLYTNYYYGHHSQLEWRKQLQVCSEDLFDKYFSLTITSNTLSEKSLKDVLATINNPVAFMQILQTVQIENKLRLVLDRLFDYLDELTEEQGEKLLIGVFDFCEDVNDPKQGMFDVRAVDEQTWRLGYQILKRVPKERRITFLTKMLHATKGVFSPVQLVNALDCFAEEHEKKEVADEALLTKEELKQPIKMCIDTLHAIAKDGTLVTNKHLVLLLQIWKAWESETAVKAYVAEVIKTTVGLLALLKGFEWDSFSGTAGDRVEERKRKINKKSLAMFADIEEINKKIQVLAMDELSEEEKETIALYNTPPDRFDEFFS
jgi:predicted KAP-like P-loop ATPase